MAFFIDLAGSEYLEGKVLSFIRANKLMLLALCGFTCLWPYYQRAFFRVTLFHQLGEISELCFSLFIGCFLFGSLVMVACGRRLSDRLTLGRPLSLAASALSLISTVYLSGAVVASTGAYLSMVLAYVATICYALSLLAISSFWMVLLIRIVYSSGLFHAVAILTASSILGFSLSPTFVNSILSTGIMPVCGMLIAGICAYFAGGLSSDDAASSQYQQFSRAPYIKTWVAPLVAYLVFAFSHGIGYANETTREVYVSDGQLMAAPATFVDYTVYLVFSIIIFIAAIRSWQESRHYQEKATFWVASMGVGMGLFAGIFLANLLNGFSSNASSTASAIAPCFPILLVVITLFMTYQNRLLPLQSFGLCFFGLYAFEKLLSYIIVPQVISTLGPFPLEASAMATIAIYAVSLVALFAFFIKFCQGDTLQMLFSADEENRNGSSKREKTTPNYSVCLSLAREYDLTNRELDILGFLAQGYSAKRMGEMLYISERTVQTHTRNIYRKMDVHTRQGIIDLVEARAAIEPRE